MVLANSVTATAKSATSVRDKMLSLESQLAARYFEREEPVRSLVLAVATREHVLYLGHPGTAKSEISQEFAGAFAGVGNFFRRLMTKFSTPEELFGAIDILALQQGVFRRKPDGKLQEASFAFLDEIFKANSAILNALLTILEERIFDDDGATVQVPLVTCIGASNEMPEGSELLALYDRFLFRHWITYIKNDDSFLDLLMDVRGDVATTFTATDLDQIHAEVQSVRFERDAAEMLLKLKKELASENLTLSDRRWKKCVKVLKAQAWLEGDDHVNEEHFPVLLHTLWISVEQMETILKRLRKIGNPVSERCKAITASIQEQFEQLQALPQSTSQEQMEWMSQAQRVSGICRGAIDELEVMARNNQTNLNKLRMIQRAITNLDQKKATIQQQGSAFFS